MSGLNRLNDRSMNAELMTQKADLLLQNQIIHEAGEKREISNSPRGQRNLKPEKSAKKRETVPSTTKKSAGVVTTMTKGGMEKR